MAPMHCLSITTAALLLHALLVPSCVQWNIGENIREGAETRVGADVTQRLFCPETQQLLAPEVTYRADTPLIAFGGGDDPAAHDVTPTGHWRVVDLPPAKPRGYFLPFSARTTVLERCASAPQAGVDDRGRELNYSPTADNARWLGTAERRREEGYALRTVFAAPFDYCVDPLLSALSTAVAVPVIGTPLLIGVCYDYIRY